MADEIINDNLIARKIGLYQPFTVGYLAEVSGATEAGAYAWMIRRAKKKGGHYIGIRWIHKNKVYMVLIPRGAVVYGLSTTEICDTGVDGGAVLR